MYRSDTVNNGPMKEKNQQSSTLLHANLETPLKSQLHNIIGDLELLVEKNEVEVKEIQLLESIRDSRLNDLGARFLGNQEKELSVEKNKQDLPRQFDFMDEVKETYDCIEPHLPQTCRITGISSERKSDNPATESMLQQALAERSILAPEGQTGTIKEEAGYYPSASSPQLRCRKRKLTGTRDDGAHAEIPLKRQSPGRTISVEVDQSIKTDSSRNTIKVRQEPLDIELVTDHACYSPLSQIFRYQNLKLLVDVLGVVTRPLERPISRRRYFRATLKITDISTEGRNTPVTIFRAFKSAMPRAAVGDCILLRNFAVKSVDHQSHLVSCMDSAWCVWSSKDKYESTGPPVEFGDAEIKAMESMQNWWLSFIT